jgi:acetyl-CoA acetyltransferase
VSSSQRCALVGNAELRAAAAIVGVGESDLGDVGPGRYSIELAAQAAARALDEAGMRTTDVDGLLTVVAGYAMPALDISEYLGLRPSYIDSTMLGGSSFVAHLHHAAMAISAGRCEVALVVYGSTPRADSGRGRVKVATEAPEYESMYNPRSPVTEYALAAARHMHEYGTTLEQLAAVAVAARSWARLNPKAFVRDPLSVADVMASRVVASPLRVLDCCLVTDGGGAVVLTSAERARSLPQAPIYLLGAGEAQSHKSISQMPDLTTTAATESARRAFDMAQITVADVDVVQLYDAFTINTILFLEDMGFCAKGEGGAFVSDGRIAPGGGLPVNTNGGGLSYGHPGMYGIFAIIEATRQLRHECGDRQVADAAVALVHGNGGWLSSQVTAVLGRGAAL